MVAEVGVGPVSALHFKDIISIFFSMFVLHEVYALKKLFKKGSTMTISSSRRKNEVAGEIDDRNVTQFVQNNLKTGRLFPKVAEHFDATGRNLCF